MRGNREHGVDDLIYILDLKRKEDILDKLSSKLKDADFPALAEPAMIHPFNKSTIKVRDTGMIDIFTADNTGFRIDPTTESINAVASSEQHYIDYLKEWIFESVDTRIGEKWDINVGENINIGAGKSFNLNTGLDTSINSKGNIVGQASKKIYLKSGQLDLNAVANIKMNSGQNMDIYSDGDINLIAKGNIKINGKKVLIN